MYISAFYRAIKSQNLHLVNQFRLWWKDKLPKCYYSRSRLMSGTIRQWIWFILQIFGHLTIIWCSQLTKSNHTLNIRAVRPWLLNDCVIILYKHFAYCQLNKYVYINHNESYCYPMLQILRWSKFQIHTIS